MPLPPDFESRAFLLSLFEVARKAADPAACVPAHLPPKPKGRTIVVGAGKAAAAMARAVEENWGGDLEGLVVTRYGHAVPCARIEVVEASHPVPDAAGEAAARRMLERVRGLGPDDLVLCLMSGGASALLSLPADGLTLADKQAVTGALLKSGATIGEMNCVRKHLSAIKGGRLALAAHPARVVSLIVSDIPGDTADADRLVALMGQDKKVRDGALTFILARNIGEAFIAHDVPPDKVRDFLARQIAG